MGVRITNSCGCGNPAKVDNLCWYCFHKKNDTLHLYHLKFGDEGCSDEKIPEPSPDWRENETKR